jgi:hypothetical protein
VRARGWTNTHVLDTSAVARAQRLLLVMEVMTYLERFVGSPFDVYDGFFRVDGNVVRLFDEFVTTFVPTALASDAALACTCGFYSGARDTIEAETDASVVQARWSHRAAEMRELVTRFRQEFGSVPCPVVSAKYVYWNTRHPARSRLAAVFIEEGRRHMQGNTILSYMAVAFPADVLRLRINTYTNGQLSYH